jgi:Cupredoxin-like domain
MQAKAAFSHPTVRVAALAAAAMAGLLATGCSSGSPAAASGSGGGGGGTVSITSSNTGFSPASVTLDKPGTYTFNLSNKASRPVSIDVEGNGVDKDAQPAPAGGTTSLTVNLTAGSYVIHSQDDGQARANEIKGTLVVKG